MTAPSNHRSADDAAYTIAYRDRAKALYPTIVLIGALLLADTTTRIEILRFAGSVLCVFVSLYLMRFATRTPKQTGVKTSR